MTESELTNFRKINAILWTSGIDRMFGKTIEYVASNRLIQIANLTITSPMPADWIHHNTLNHLKLPVCPDTGSIAIL